FLDGNPDEDRGYGENGDDGPSDFAKAITAQIALHAPGGNADLVNSFIYSFEGEDISGDGIGGLSWTEDVEGERENLYENAGVFVWDIWGQWRPLAFNDKLLLAFNGGIGKTFDNYQTWNRENIGVDENSDTWWGAAVYAKYQLTDVVSIALRGEYFHDDDGTARVQDLDRNYRDNENWDFHNGGDGDNPEWGPLWVNSTDLWSVTATVGLDLWENMLCRLEYRLDIASSDGGNAIENGDGNEDGVEQNIFTNNQSTQHTFILNLSYSF
ncbi:MAG: outer membrane beta-barrel protein, partial [Verrucomicrobiales bacterium]|nr:outer membrane beta-barrel protein [Verrucomicrobiales bacterium]